MENGKWKIEKGKREWEIVYAGGVCMVFGEW